MKIRGYGQRIGALLGSAAFLAGAILAANAVRIDAQGPPSVPSFRAYGSVTVNGAPAPAGATVTAVSAASAGTTCGTGTVSGASATYFVDIQALPGCLGTISFTVNGQPASNPPTSPPMIQGSPQQVNLTVSPGAATPAPPPPPTVIATPPPPPPPPPPAAAATPAPAATPVATAVVPAAPPNTGVGPGPARPVEVQPANVAPGAVVAAPPTAPQLPNTGSGDLLQRQPESGPLPWLPVALLVSLGVFASSLVAWRRSR